MSFHSYSPSEGHGLKYSPFKALIAPRPIGWISTVSKSGVVNLAPYSFFNALCELPPILGFTSYGRKDTLINIEETGEFVHNVTPTKMLEAMNQTSGLYAKEINEMDKAGLESLPSELVAPPRIASAPATMECKLLEIKRMIGLDGVETDSWLVLGEVVRIHIDKAFLVDGMVDEEALGLLGRLGYFNYAGVDDVLTLKRPEV